MHEGQDMVQRRGIPNRKLAEWEIPGVGHLTGCIFSFEFLTECTLFSGFSALLRLLLFSLTTVTQHQDSFMLFLLLPFLHWAANLWNTWTCCKPPRVVKFTSEITALQLVKVKVAICRSEGLTVLSAAHSFKRRESKVWRGVNLDWITNHRGQQFKKKK